MAFFEEITGPQRALIETAPLFFVASAAPDLSPNPAGEGPINVSPKGGCKLQIIDPKTVAYLDYPGSGNETARHAQAGGPVTLMVMSTEPENAAIVRLYGRAKVEPLEQSPLAERLLALPAPNLAKKARQAVIISVERTQTSCGYGVPVMEYRGHRTAQQRGRAFRGQ